jgi:hypothetical protein
MFTELITLLLENIILKDYFIKYKSLIKRIDKSEIKLMFKIDGFIGID